MEQLPQAFIEQTRLLLGEEEYTRLETALKSESPVSIRINEAKLPAFQEPVAGSIDRVPWCETGYYLKERPAFTFDPLFHAGAYYVQEASSMFIEQVLRVYATEPVVALDLCAAPGGKSTHLRSLLPGGSLLVSNEIIRNRSQVLAENLVKWGHPEIVVTNNDPSEFAQLEGFFDLILTDVPCSGEGMFRKDPGAVEEWSTDNVNICRQRQKKIIADIWNSLKPGGILIYSTCTFNKKEDEENVNWMVSEYAAEPLPVNVPPEWGIAGSLTAEALPVYRFFPHKTKGEGFFLAAVRKPVGVTTQRRDRFKIKPDKKQLKAQAVPEICKSWLQDTESLVFEMRDSLVSAFPKNSVPQLAALRQTLRIVHSGIFLGELKGKDLVPHHSLAMSLYLDKSAFPVVNVSYQQAIAYLRKEVLVFENEVPRGYVLLMYRNYPLGFVKNIGNRANNLYPQEWRIRSGYLPAEVNVL